MTINISIIGAPMDFGQHHRGVDMGPAAMRYTGLVSRLRNLGHTVMDTGDVIIPTRDSSQIESKKKYLKEITQTCELLYKAGKETIDKGGFPLFLGGDHSISVGTVAAATDKEPLGLIWMDAHGDFNIPETSPFGNIHGMPVSALIGEGHKSLVNVGNAGPKIDPENIVMIGQRDLDTGEKKRLKKAGVTVFTMRDIDE
jgi:arginase